MPFLDYHVIGITYCAAWWDRLRSLSNKPNQSSSWRKTDFFLALNIFCWLNVLCLVSLFTTEGDLGCLEFASKFWQLWIKLLLRSAYWLLVGHGFSVPLYKYQGIWLLYGPRKGLDLSETAKRSFNVSVPLCIFTSNEWETQFLYTLARFGGVGIPGFDHFPRSMRGIPLLSDLQSPDSTWCCTVFHILHD